MKYRVNGPKSDRLNVCVGESGIGVFVSTSDDRHAPQSAYFFDTKEQFAAWFLRVIEEVSE